MTLALVVALLLSPSQASVIKIDLGAITPISPYIYGCNFPAWDKMHLPFTMSRLGGNRMTAYNWETNASNAGNDWHHQNDGFMGESDEPGFTMRRFMEDAQKNGAIPLLTVPTAGYVSADKKGDGDVNQTPNYLETRFFKSYARKPGSKFAYPPDTKDKAVYQDEFVSWIEKVRAKSIPIWYSLDNEPDLWHSTHARIHPIQEAYQGIIDNNIEFSKAIKDVAPKALTFGPANYGFMGFRTFQNAPDANGRDFLDTYLEAMKAAEKQSGRRLLDVLDIHWYPEAQGDGVRVVMGNDKPGTPLARIQAPRSLWDPTYVEQSWIADFLGKKPIVLLPTVLSQIKAHYPGTHLGITEYDYGGGTVVSGMLAQADVLGIWGRYGVFAAAHFGLEPADSAQLAGFRAYLDYDGKGGHFGSQSLPVSGESAESDSVYASLDPKRPGVVIVVVINKTSSSRAYRFDGIGPSNWESWTITGPDFAESKHASGTKNFDAPPLSVSTIELKRTGKE